MAYFLRQNNEDESKNVNQNSGGNIYSTSQSEVSSISDSGDSGNSNYSGNQSNQSGNWVNLNKYLDANQGKIGKYVDTLVNPYTSKVEGYKTSLDTNKQRYNQDVNNQASVNTDKGKSGQIITSYAQDAGSVGEDDWKALQGTLGGYTGPAQYSLSGDQYGYRSDRKTADDFGNFGSNFENQDYRMSLMDKNLSSGGKKLNNFLIGASSDAQNKVKDYASQFRDLASLLDQNETDLNSIYDNAVSISEQNQKDALENIERIEKETRKKLEDTYEAQKQAAIEANRNLDNAVEHRTPGMVYINGGIPISADLYKSNNFDTKSKIAEDNYRTELRELADRMNSIRNNARIQDGSKLDSTFDFGGWYLTPEERQRQIQRYSEVGYLTNQAVPNSAYSKLYSLLDINNYSPAALQAKDLRARYIKGEITGDYYKRELGKLVV